jgi:hypothetical protein
MVRPVQLLAYKANNNMRRRIFFSMALAVAATAVTTTVFTRSSDMPLSITSEHIAQLDSLRREPKFVDLPGAPAEQERIHFEPLLNALLDRLIEGIAQHPSRTWILQQMDPFVATFYLQDTELRESCLDYLTRIFGIFGIPDDDGAFRKYMIFW